MVGITGQERVMVPNSLVPRCNLLYE